MLSSISKASGLIRNLSNIRALIRSEEELAKRERQSKNQKFV